MLDANDWGLRCPLCKSTTSIYVTVTTEARLTPDGTDADDPGIHEGGHHWTDSSPARCGCGFLGAVLDFQPVDQQPMIPAASYIAAASHRGPEIDDPANGNYEALVSRGDDAGSYVKVWLWVEDSDVMLASCTHLIPHLKEADSSLTHSDAAALAALYGKLIEAAYDAVCEPNFNGEPHRKLSAALRGALTARDVSSESDAALDALAALYAAFAYGCPDDLPDLTDIGLSGRAFEIVSNTAKLA